MDDRTQIAAMLLSGLLSNPNRSSTPDVAVKQAVDYTDKLIEKLKEVGNDNQSRN